MSKTMDRAAQLAARLYRAGARVWQKRWGFLVLFAAVFALSVAVLAVLDLLPEEPPAPLVTVATTPAVSAPALAAPQLPVKISASSIGLAVSVNNPESTSIAVLDGWLLKGAVRYPSSARLGQEGNVVLFGHSSYLPVVGNPAYKAFNNIQKLKAGDRIEVAAEGAVYVYAVRSVSKEDAAANTPIPLSSAGQELTLVTCDSFGKKSDRFVVVADFVESYAVPS